MKSEWAARLKLRVMVSLAIFLAVVVAATTAAISTTVGRAVRSDSEAVTTEIGSVVRVGLAELMLTRNPERIGRVVAALGSSRSVIKEVFILDRGGTIRYSTRAGDVGRTVDRTADATCIVCHRSGEAPAATTQIVRQADQRYLRNVTVLFNEQACQTCHDAGDRIVGKVVVDRPMDSTDRLLGTVRSIVIGVGLFSLVVLAVSVPAVGRSIDRYVREIGQQESEVTVLYTMVKHLSKSIEPRALRAIMLRTTLATFGADEVVIVLAGEAADREGYRFRRGDHAESRTAVDADGQIREAFDRWAATNPVSITPMSVGKIVAVPLSQGGVRLGVILIRRPDLAIDAQTKRLLVALARHASVALQNARLHALAVTDDLTQLYTSRHFRTCLDAGVDRYGRQQEPFALVFLDIDNFKQVNDTFGHLVGDDVLRRVSGAMVGWLRATDLAFRYGGEELTALLPGADAGVGIAIAEAVRQGVEQLRAPGWPGDLRVTVSAGVAACPGDATTARELVMRADAALYAAKRAGKNRVVRADQQA